MNNRLQHLFKTNALSQEELAKLWNISRPTVAKILAGKREIKMSEAKALAQMLGISIGEVFGDQPSPEIVLGKSKKAHKADVRISVPAQNVEKFKNALLYITEKIGAFPNVGQTVLYKILYFCDFDYYEKFEEQLIGAKYIRNHYGPTPMAFKAIVKEMVRDGQIEEIKTKYFNKEQTKYIPVVRPDLAIFSGQELKHIDEEIARFGDKSAKELSVFSHKDVPWMVTAEGQEIPYETVFYRTPETSVRVYEDDKL